MNDNLTGEGFKERALPSMKDLAMNGKRQMEMKPRVATAVQGLRERMPNIRPNGVFRHPPDWTQEELDFIADCLKQNVPLYTIANMVHCERSCLSRLIKKTPELAELKENQHENILDEAEYQADRLAKSGNASIVMFILQTLGKKRGWSTTDMESGNKDDDSRIVMGVIPDADVKKANEDIQKIREETEKKMNPGGVMTDPMAMAAIEETVKTEVAEQIKASTPKAIDVGDVKVSEPPYSEGYGDGGYSGNYEIDSDPWAAGADSMFSQ